MSDIDVRPRRIGSRDFDLNRDGMRVAELHVPWVGRTSKLEADLTEYDLVRTGGRTWELRRHSLPDVVATVGRPRIVSSRHWIEWGRRSLEVRPARLRARFDLVEADAVVGVARPPHLLSNSLVITIPDDVPTFVTALVVWSVVRIRRASSGGA